MGLLGTKLDGFIDDREIDGEGRCRGDVGVLTGVDSVELTEAPDGE